MNVDVSRVTFSARAIPSSANVDHEPQFLEFGVEGVSLLLGGEGAVLDLGEGGLKFVSFLALNVELRDEVFYLFIEIPSTISEIISKIMLNAVSFRSEPGEFGEVSLLSLQPLYIGQLSRCLNNFPPLSL